jgi:hypothetical protein
MEKLNSQTHPVAQVVCTFMAAAGPVNIIKSFCSSETGFIVNEITSSVESPRPSSTQFKSDMFTAHIHPWRNGRWSRGDRYGTLCERVFWVHVKSRGKGRRIKPLINTFFRSVVIPRSRFSWNKKAKSKLGSWQTCESVWGIFPLNLHSPNSDKEIFGSELRCRSGHLRNSRVFWTMENGRNTHSRAELCCRTVGKAASSPWHRAYR